MSYYFAYGSNMALEAMRDSLPDATDAGPARLDDHRLRFSRHSQRWDAGAADVVPAPSLVVWGRLYELPDPFDIERLDAREGFLSGAYRRETVEVHDWVGKPVEALTYTVVDKLDVEEAPTPEYLGLMLDGATSEPSLPERYLTFLAHLETRAREAGPGEPFRQQQILYPTTTLTGRGSGPLLLSGAMSWWEALFRPYAAVRIGDREMLVQAKRDPTLPPDQIRVDQVVRASLTTRHNESFGYDASVFFVRRPLPRLPRLLRQRTTVLTVQRPAVTDSEKNIAVLHEKPLQLLGIGPGAFVRIRSVDSRSERRKISSISIRAYSGSDADLRHAGRPVYPTELEVDIDGEDRRRLGVRPGDAVWVSASTWPLLRERLFFYAITAFLGIAALLPIFNEFGVASGTGILLSAGITLLVTLAVAVAELRQKIGA